MAYTRVSRAYSGPSVAFTQLLFLRIAHLPLLLLPIHLSPGPSLLLWWFPPPTLPPPSLVACGGGPRLRYGIGDLLPVIGSTRSMTAIDKQQ